MTWKAYAAVSGAGVLATYLGLGRPAIAPERVATEPNAAPVATRPAIDIQREALRLNRVAPDHGFQEPGRDPFRFASRPARATRASQLEEAPPPPQVAAPEPPPIRLSGITTRTVEGQRQRTAILITPQGVTEAREGDAVVSGYSVTRIQDDSVELTGPDGVIRRLMLRP